MGIGATWALRLKPKVDNSLELASDMDIGIKFGLA